MEENEKLIKKIQNHWDENVCGYNKSSNFDEIDKQRLKVYPYLSSELDIENDRDKIILEIGVGAASDACLSLRLANPKKYVLFDLSTQTLQVAKSHLESHCADKNFEFVNGNASDLSCFNDSEFDRIKAIGSIHHMPEYQKVIKEIARVLKPGGDFIFMFYNKDSRRIKYTYPRFENRGRNSVSQLVLEIDGKTNPYTILLTESEIRKICSDTGLTCTSFRKRELIDLDRLIFFGKFGIKIFPKFLEKIWGLSLYVRGKKVSSIN